MYRTLCSIFLKIPALTRRPRDRRTYGTVDAITKLIAFVSLIAAASVYAQNPEPSIIRGTVVDARTGSPLPRILVAVEGGPSVETAPDGTFALTGVAAGQVRLYVSAVGYGLVQRSLQVSPGATLDLRIPLSEGSATYTETVTVTADRFRRPEPVAAQQVLGSAELMNLRGVLADDALRAVQVMPGVATGDDFKSEFSVRGTDFSHLNFTVDGFATPFVMHMVRAVEERANSGSVSMINGDVLENVTLSNGGYPQRSGNRTGAELEFTMREGSRDRTVVRALVSGTSASATVEGPIGRLKRGSWLLSGRKSYLDLLIKKLREEGLSFGFADIQAKFRYDLTSRQSASLTFITGKSRLRELPEEPDDNDLFIGDNASAILIATWRATMRNGVVTASALGATNSFRNHTDLGIDLERGTNDQIGLRTDLSLALTRAMQVETGVLLEHAEEFQRKQRQVTATTTVPLNDYRADALRSGAYARARIQLGPRVVVSPGARIDHWDLTDQTTGSPWLQTEWTLPRHVVIRAGGGLYQQFPDFEKVVGAFAGTGIRPERAVHADVSIEHRLSPSVRAQLTLYNRQDEDLIRRPGSETRLVAGRVVRGSLTSTFANRLDGYSRGVELLLQRSSPEGLSGWFSYSFGKNWYEDQVNGEAFWGDLDQRHTLNAQVTYRFSHRFSASAKYRAGSNFPVPGYYSKQGETFFVSDQRNTLRLPAYGRLDVRANRTFDWSRKRLTLFAEVINVLNQDNVRFNPPRISIATRQVTRLFEPLIPVIPSAGVLLEF